MVWRSMLRTGDPLRHGTCKQDQKQVYHIGTLPCLDPTHVIHVFSEGRAAALTGEVHFRQPKPKPKHAPKMAVRGWREKLWGTEDTQWLNC